MHSAQFNNVRAISVYDFLNYIHKIYKKKKTKKKTKKKKEKKKK